MYGISVLFSSRVVSKRSIRRYSSDSTKKLLEFLADMPKATSARIAEAQRQRQQITKKSEKYGPSTVYLQVIGSGARGAPNTLYLFTDQKRYLFNCGECTQRLAHEHKVKLSRLDHIFITSKTWRNIGGLPGLSLTLQDVGVPNITLHGPEGLDDLYTATKRFVIMKDMNVTMAKCSPLEDFEDNVMNVKYVLLGPMDNILQGKEKPAAKRPRLDSNSEREYEEFIHDDTDYYRSHIRNMEANSSNAQKNKHLRDKPKSKPLHNEKENAQKKKTDKVLHELQKKTNCSVAYICTLKKRLGTLDLAKCVELGVKPGPMLGQLKSGQDVVLPDGSLVMSKDVKTPDDPGPVFIVLDVPDLTYLKETEFSAHFDNARNPPENIPALIVHFTPPHVFHHPTYRSFMAMFGPCTRHLVLNAQNCCLGSEAVHRTQHKLHLLDPDIFPLLRDVSVPAVWNAHPPVPKTNSPIRLKGLEELKNKIALAQFQNIINLEGSAKGDGHQPTVEECDSIPKLELLAGRTLTMYHLRPKKQLDRTAEPKLHIQSYIQETMDVDGFVGSLEQFRHLVDGMRYARCDSKEYPKVVFLGTGSCIPSKTRNTSAIVLHIDENKSILLDCGEGTFGQLVRFYGPKKVNSFLRTLKAIYISHLHADHHIGLIGVIQARREALHELNAGSEHPIPAPPLYLLAPGQIITWLTWYDHQFEKIKNEFTLIPNQNLLHDHAHNQEVSSAVLAAMGVQNIKTCHVAHCPNAFGVAVELDDGYKVTYSGDTLPCDELVRIGENSTLLIHEATMEDELADEARMKMHSTTTQAIDIGRQMKARYTVLTHFSQRYARLPRLNAHILNDNNSVGIAFDNMQITMSDLDLLPHMYAPLQLMFAEHCVEMELKAAHRQRQRDRQASPLPDSTSSRLQSLSRGRRVPSTGATVSPAPRLRYRESNASRLRQEIKGMTVWGTVRKPRSRSNSASTSGSHEVTVTKAKLDEPRSSSLHSQSDHISNDVHISMKESNVSSSPNVVNTRSKTLSSVGPSHLPSAEEVLEVMGKNRNTHRFHSIVGHAKQTTDAGYGKPLVTPINKKLTIMREEKWYPTLNPSNEKITTGVPAPKTPTRTWKAENREGAPRNTAKQPDLMLIPKTLVKCHKFDVVTSVLGHILFWRVARMTAYVYPICGSNGIVIVTILAFAVLFWTATKSSLTGNKLRASNTNPNVFPETKTPALRSNVASRLRTIPITRPSASSLPRNKSPTRQYKTICKPQEVLSVQTKQRYDRNMKSKDKRITKPWKPEVNSRACDTPPRSPTRTTTPIGVVTPTRVSSPAPKRSLPSETNKPCDTPSLTPSEVSSPTRVSSPAPKRTLLSEINRVCAASRDPSRSSSTAEVPSTTRASSPAPKKILPSETTSRICSTPPRSANRTLSPTRGRVTSPTRASSPAAKRTLPSEPTNKQMIPNDDDDIANEKLIKESFLSFPTRGPPGPYNRSFKPQLEDIKSSNLLVNKKDQDKKSCPMTEKTEENIPSQSKFNEELRRRQLNEVKKKFQSKRFFTDSKYDKIEGLNWITWK
ncbi:uncharacterized protein LOC118281764 isoform X4 [Spodoptera frugiperda]|uniref:Zinc phosphodiesterase ELAC protein 2 n=1 Tax=Spodoptera frugiperda TaxID=7108 RepID=A0A9R0ET79_SPOFR|nr:uncharacterized protein LOC118281764 isoform X4 [Spodoptera frugiperda]